MKEPIGCRPGSRPTDGGAAPGTPSPTAGTGILEAGALDPGTLDPVALDPVDGEALVDGVAADLAAGPPAAGSGPAGPSRTWPVFAVTALGAFVGSLDLSIVNVAFPAIGRSFPHDSRADLAWIITGYSIVFGSLLVTGGKIGDRRGRRRTFLAGLVIFAVGSALCGVAPSVATLIGGRLLQGGGAALAIPSSLGLLLGAYPPARRPQMVAMWAGVGALAVATGPSLGALLVTEWGWRWVFDVNLPICAVTILVGRAVLARDGHGAPSTRADIVGVVILTAALAAAVLGISEGDTWGWGDARTVAAFATTVVLLPVFVRRCRRHPDPVVDLGLFRSRTLALADVATAVYSMGFFAMLLGNILFLTGVWHWSILRAGLAITPSPIIVALIARPAGRAAARLGYRRVLVPGSVVFTAALAWYGLRVGARPEYLTEWLPGTLLAGVGIGLTFPVLGAAAVAGLPPERFAVGSAVNQTARQIGGAVGVALLVVVLGADQAAASLHAFGHLWAFEAAAAAASGVTACFLPGRTTAPTA